MSKKILAVFLTLVLVCTMFFAIFSSASFAEDEVWEYNPREVAALFDESLNAGLEALGYDLTNSEEGLLPDDVLVAYMNERGMSAAKPTSKGVVKFTPAKGRTAEWVNKAAASYTLDDVKGRLLSTEEIARFMTEVAPKWVPPPMMPDGVTPWQGPDVLLAELEAAPKYHIAIEPYRKLGFPIPKEFEDVEYASYDDWECAFNNGEYGDVLLDFKYIDEWAVGLDFQKFTEKDVQAIVVDKTKWTKNFTLMMFWASEGMFDYIYLEPTMRVMAGYYK